jgi:hypothetical protein
MQTTNYDFCLTSEYVPYTDNMFRFYAETIIDNQNNLNELIKCKYNEKNTNY